MEFAGCNFDFSQGGGFTIIAPPPVPPAFRYLWTWGLNTSYQLGDGTGINRSSPVQTVAGGTNWANVSIAGLSTAGIKTDGTLWTWGYNYYGDLGTNNRTYHSSPVQTIAGGTNWSKVAVSENSKLAIKTDGTLWAWGRDEQGQLGDNASNPKSSPVQTIAGGTNWTEVSAGGYTSAAIKTDGTLWTWGANFDGKLGDNTVINKSSPVQTAAGGTTWSKIAVGGSNTMAAIKTDGTLWMWGGNYYGQLGDNTRIDKSSPVQTVAGGTSWRTVAAGVAHTVAIKSNGTLWTWGTNYNGEIGDNSASHRSSPVQTVAGGSNWANVASAGYQTTAALKTDGTLWTWGRNNFGQLGDSTTTNRSSPVQTTAAGTTWLTVSIYKSVAAIKSS